MNGKYKTLNFSDEYRSENKGSRKNSDSTLECIQTLSTEVGMHSDRESVFP